MFKSHLLLLCLSTLLLSPLAAHAAGAAVIAKADRHLWPEAVNTSPGFDKASRAAILNYVMALKDMEVLSDSEMLLAFKIKSVNRASVKKWLDKELALSVQNYQAAAKNCTPGDWTCIGNITRAEDMLAKAQNWRKAIPATLNSWHNNNDNFVRTYIAEQMRLAALFPKVSSEIDTFNANEWNGDQFSDRQFLLTFDDGPTAASGDTDKVMAMLAAGNKTAVFFVLGEYLQNRLNKTDAAKLAELYKNQCVGSHGWEHQSHARWNQWQSSITRNKELLQSSLKSNYVPLFRPPYGQRKADSESFFKKQGLQVVLWNLDSQDWNKQLNAEDIINRMITLMLIKRHGVILFHDIVPKAGAALPVISSELGNAVEWMDCHSLTK